MINIQFMISYHLQCDDRITPGGCDSVFFLTFAFLYFTIFLIHVSYQLFCLVLWNSYYWKHFQSSLACHTIMSGNHQVHQLPHSHHRMHRLEIYLFYIFGPIWLFLIWIDWCWLIFAVTIVTPKLKYFCQNKTNSRFFEACLSVFGLCQ